MLESNTDDRYRPDPVDAEWEPETSDGVVGVRIAATADDQSAAWLWSSHWLDLVAKR